MILEEKFCAKGHKNIKATHVATLMVTLESHLTRRGDCVIAVEAEKSLVDLSEKFKMAARNTKAVISMMLKAQDRSVVIFGSGDPRLNYLHISDMVVRKSDYVCDRTLMIKADMAAFQIDRKFINVLKNPSQVVNITLKVNL